MQRLVHFLKQAFTVPASHRLPATASEMTFHDALRICTGRVPAEELNHTNARRMRQSKDSVT